MLLLRGPLRLPLYAKPSCIRLRAYQVCLEHDVLSDDINDVRPFLDGVNRSGMQPGSDHGSILGSHRIPSNNPERKPNNG